ncbi:MAG: Nudix family hydrolase [Gammaproteobacteria bacterium]
MSPDRLHIAVGVIFNKSRDKVLLSRRSDDVPQGGLWEFPGGKLLPGEGVEEALARELFEELDLVIHHAQPLIVIDHDYPLQSVTLDVWTIDKWDGEVTGREGQLIEWVSLEGLSERKFPGANHSIISAIKLPPLYLITPNLTEHGDGFLDTAKTCLEAGAKLIQLRSLYPDRYYFRKLAGELVELCNRFHCRLIINSTPDEMLRLGAHGVHLSSKHLLQQERRPLAKEYWVAASCHDELELEHACRIGVDFAVLSPVSRTNSHPGKEPMGWDRFEEMACAATIPVYALGGMQPTDIEVARGRGGQGVAMISGIWEAPDPGAAIRMCMAAANV